MGSPESDETIIDFFQNTTIISKFNFDLKLWGRSGGVCGACVTLGWKE